MLLVTFNDNYADEFDVEGFAVVSEKLWTDFSTRIHEFFKTEKTEEFYFGSNERIVYKSVKEIMECFSVKRLSTAEVFTLERLFGNTFYREEEQILTFGIIPDLYEFCWLEEEEENC